jgi:autotransporter-associated beta strand protein
VILPVNPVRLSITVDVFGQQPLGSLRFDQGGYTITGSSFVLTGSTNITTNSASGTNTLNITLDLRPFQGGIFIFFDHIFNIASGGTLVVNGKVTSAPLNLVDKIGGGILTFSNGSNDYGGSTDIHAGTLRVGGNFAVPSSTAVEVAPGATFDVGNFGDRIGSLSDLDGGGGHVTIPGGSLGVGDLNTDTTFSGDISNPSGIITKFGSGTLRLNGNSPSMPPTGISSGTLLVNGTAPAFIMNVSTSATLGGTGTVGPISVFSGGTVAPGDTNPGSLRSGNALLRSGSNFRVRLNGIANYDQLQVTGTVDLTQLPNLNATLGYASSVGDTFTILTSTAGISGAFNGLPNNAILTLSGTPFQITYSAHGVSLRQVAPDQPLTPSGRTINTTEGAVFTGVVASFTDADPSAVASNFTARIDWGNSQSSAGTIARNGSVFEVSGTNAYAEEGSYPITVVITDIDTSHDIGGSTATAHSIASVADAALSADAVTFNQPVGTEGFPITNLTLAYFSDAGGPESTSNYTATIDWGDNTAPSTGTVSRNGTQFSVSGSHTYVEEDPRTVRVTIQDEGGSTVTVTTPITLYDAALSPTALPVSATEGAAFTVPVATFIDTGGPEAISDYVATIDWGDGMPADTGTISLSSGTFTVTGSHTYAEEGRYVVSLSVQHETTGTCIFETIATVADAPLNATANPVGATEGAAFNGVVASFTDTAALEPASHYSAVIDWGDGHTSAGLLQANGSGGYDVIGTNTYAEEGTYTFTVTIQDEGGSSNTVTGTATVADASLSAFGTSLSGTAGAALANVAVAFFADAGGAEPTGNYTATIDWGDTTPLDSGTINGSGSSFQVTGNHTYAAAGTFTVQVTIVDEGGSSITVTTSATISDGGGGGAGGGAAPGGPGKFARLHCGDLPSGFWEGFSQDALYRAADSSVRAASDSSTPAQGAPSGQAAAVFFGSPESQQDLTQGFHRWSHCRFTDPSASSADGNLLWQRVRDKPIATHFLGLEE